MWLLGVEVDVAASGPSQLIALLKKKKKKYGVMSKDQGLRENAQNRGQLKELPAKAGTIWVEKEAIIVLDFSPKG